MFLFLISYNSYSQFGLGIKFGLNSFDIADDNFTINDENGTVKYEVNFVEAKYGYHLGIYGDAQFGFFSIQPAAIFNTSKINYKINDILNPENIVKSFKFYTNLDVPLLLGINISRFRIQGGPVAHIILSSSKDVLEMENYEEMFKKATYGYQAGIAIKLLWNMRIEFMYEGGLEEYGEQFIYNGTPYQFSKRHHRLIGSFVMKFL